VTVAFIQLTAVLVLILLAIALVLLSWNWAEWSDARARAGVLSRFGRWRLQRRLSRELDRIADELAEAIR
jgi:hypothetical protein